MENLGMFEAFGVAWELNDVRSYREDAGLVRIASATARGANGERLSSLGDELTYRGRQYGAPYVTVEATLQDGTYRNVWVHVHDVLPEGMRDMLRAHVLDTLGAVAPLTQAERGLRLNASATLVGGNDGRQAVRDAVKHPARPSGLYSREAWDVFAATAAEAYRAAIVGEYR